MKNYLSLFIVTTVMSCIPPPIEIDETNPNSLFERKVSINNNGDSSVDSTVNAVLLEIENQLYQNLWKANNNLRFESLYKFSLNIDSVIFENEIALFEKVYNIIYEYSQEIAGQNDSLKISVIDLRDYEVFREDSMLQIEIWLITGTPMNSYPSPPPCPIFDSPLPYDEAAENITDGWGGGCFPIIDYTCKEDWEIVEYKPIENIDGSLDFSPYYYGNFDETLNPFSIQYLFWKNTNQGIPVISQFSQQRFMDAQLELFERNAPYANQEKTLRKTLVFDRVFILSSSKKDLDNINTDYYHHANLLYFRTFHDPNRVNDPCKPEAIP